MSIHLTYEYSPKIPSSICVDIPILYNPPYPHIPIQSYTLKAKIPIKSYQNSTVFPIHPMFPMIFHVFPAISSGSPARRNAPGHPFGSPKNCRPAPRCNSSAARHSRPQQAPGKWIYHNVIYHYRISIPGTSLAWKKKQSRGLLGIYLGASTRKTQNAKRCAPKRGPKRSMWESCFTPYCHYQCIYGLGKYAFVLS